MPFYDPGSEEIPPLGRLIIKRKAVLPNTCRAEDEYKREAFNATSTSEDEEYKDRRKSGDSVKRLNHDLRFTLQGPFRRMRGQ